MCGTGWNPRFLTDAAASTLAEPMAGTAGAEGAERPNDPGGVRHG